MGSPEVAALYVCRTGPYFGRDDVDPWDVERDARKYDGPLPVVAHPPCAAWCQLAGLREARYGYPKGEDDGVFEAALASVREWGGVLEHPAYTHAWAEYGLSRPPRSGWAMTMDGGWVCQVSQAAYGHRARKLTWLYYVGESTPAPMNWGLPAAEAHVRGPTRPVAPGGADQSRYGDRPRVWSAEAKRTPPAFAEALIDLAKNSVAKPTPGQMSRGR